MAPSLKPVVSSPAMAGVVQHVAAPDLIDVRIGQAQPELLPAALLAATGTPITWGPTLLMYGANQGAAPLISAIADRAEVLEGNRPRDEQICVTAGASHGLELLCATLSRPGDAVLVESPTYGLALRIFADHGLTVIAIPDDGWGNQATIDHIVSEAERSGHPVRLAYVMPTFRNPTGGSISAVGRRQLLRFAERYGFTIIEDDVYRELSYDGPAPEPLQNPSRANDAVIRLGSFSKVIGPGMRTGWMVASDRFVAGIARRGIFESGGGVAHFAGLHLADLMSSGGYARHVDGLCGAYRARRDAFVAAFGESDRGCQLVVPGGGMFVWIALPTHCREASVVDEVASRGVAVAPGRAFYRTDGESPAPAVRVAFCGHSPDVMAEVGCRLGAAVEAAA